MSLPLELCADNPVPGINCDMYTGQIDKATRNATVDRFQDLNSSLSVMLISTMAGGVGLNLTAVGVYEKDKHKLMCSGQQSHHL